MARVKPGTLDEVAAKKQTSTAQLLFKCARLWNEIAMATVNAEAGGTVLRPAHTALFPHIDFHGTRPTEIARRAGISKQAVGQVLDELEAAGMVERIVDPEDKRARLVRFTQRGAAGIMHGLGVLGRLESRFAGKIGAARMRELRSILTDLEPVLEQAAPRV